MAFNENELACLGLKASGVKCISTLRESEIKSLITYRKDEKGKMLLLTSEGCERIYDISYSELTARLGKNHSIFKCYIICTDYIFTNGYIHIILCDKSRNSSNHTIF